MARPRRAPHKPGLPQSPGPHPDLAVGDVFRGRVVALDELEATLNAWHAAGFTDLSWELLSGAGWGDEAEAWKGAPRAFAWAWRE